MTDHMKIFTFASLPEVTGPSDEERTFTRRRRLARLTETFVESERRDIFVICSFQLDGIDVKVAVDGSGAAMLGDVLGTSRRDCHCC